MALKALMLRKKIDSRNKELEALIEKRSAFSVRESELETAIAEAETAEDEATVEEAIEALNAEKAENDKAVEEKEAEIAGLKAELEAEEKDEPEETEEPTEELRSVEPEPVETRNERSYSTMNKRNVFANMDVQTRNAIFAQEDVKNWIGEFRSAMKEKRAIANVGLTIPQVMLGILRENTENYSKLMSKVDARYIKGTARMLVGGSIPEAVWTECCANLNELDLSFSDIEADCWKIGGYMGICNASLEDSDLDLAAEILFALGQAIGYAVDKAILYGRNTSANSKMPLGIVSRLAQTSQPAGYSATARPWVDLHSTHILTIADTVTGLSLFTTILADNVVTSDKYAKGSQTWIMNKTTYAFLQTQAASITATGAIVTGMGPQMPIIGGDVVLLDFVPNYVIITGYLENYLLVVRHGVEFGQSEHVKFLQDKTLFKATQRMDGAPVIAEAFTAIGVNGVTPDATMTFAADNANTVQQIVLNKNTAAVTAATGTNHTVKLTALLMPDGVEGAVTWASSAEGKATVSSAGVVTGVASGSAVITATCGDAVAVCNVTVS